MNDLLVLDLHYDPSTDHYPRRPLTFAKANLCFDRGTRKREEKPLVQAWLSRPGSWPRLSWHPGTWHVLLFLRGLWSPSWHLWAPLRAHYPSGSYFACYMLCLLLQNQHLMENGPRLGMDHLRRCEEEEAFRWPWLKLGLNSKGSCCAFYFCCLYCCYFGVLLLLFFPISA